MVKRHAQRARFPDGIGKTDLHTIATKSPLWGLGQQPLDVSLCILQCSPISAACTANESLAGRMLKHIMLVLSMKNKTMLFNKLKQCASIVL
jgi:hypothetical protein